MITASSSPKRRILTPEHGCAKRRARRYLLSRLEQPCGSAAALFSRPATSSWPAGRGARRPERLTMNITHLLSVLVDMTASANVPRDQLGGDPDAVIRELYSHHARALRGYVAQFCPDGASADDIVQETFIRAWRHLPQLSADGRPVRPWLFRVARNLLIDANRAARARPATVQAESAEEGFDDTG